MNAADWVVTIGKETPLVDNSVHKVTGERIYPEGFVVGQRVEMTLQHTPTGVTLARVDNFAPYSEAAVRKYVVAVATAYETHVASATYSAIGAVALPAPVTPTPEQLRLAAFQAADRTHTEAEALLAKLKAADPTEAAALDAILVKRKAERDAAAAAVIADVKAADAGDVGGV